MAVEIKIDEWGNKHWYKDGDLHREDGPAVECANGNKTWFINNKLHRLDGPAVENNDGSQYWYRNGELHREDGPAIIFSNGEKQYWMYGGFITDDLYKEVERFDMIKYDYFTFDLEFIKGIPIFDLINRVDIYSKFCLESNKLGCFEFNVKFGVNPIYLMSKYKEEEFVKNFLKIIHIGQSEKMIERVKLRCICEPNFFDDSGEIDLLKIMKLFIDNNPKEFFLSLSRLRKKIEGRIPQSNNNFLEFTKDTAYNWGGPIEMNGKLGAEYSFYKRDNKIPEFQFVTNSVFKMSQDFEKLTYEEKVNKFNALPTEDKYRLLKKQAMNLMEEIDHWLPYQIHLGGNDDTSYSKYFATEEEREDELNYLLMMQPLHFEKDIIDRGYLFTN
jgi:hypothetical protein